MQELSFLQPLSLAIASGATTPAAPTGTTVWSTTTNSLMVYTNAGTWQPVGSGSGGQSIGQILSLARGGMWG